MLEGTVGSFLPSRVDRDRLRPGLDPGPPAVFLVGQAGGYRDEPDLVVLVDGLRLSLRFDHAAEAARLGDGRAARGADRAARLHDVIVRPSAVLAGHGEDHAADDQVAIEGQLDTAHVIAHEPHPALRGQHAIFYLHRIDRLDPPRQAV